MRRKLLVLLALTLVIVQGLAAQSALPIGDVDGNGQVTISDVTEVISVMLGGSDNMLADVNGDGQVTIADATELISMILNGQVVTLQIAPTSLIFGDSYVGQSKQLSFTVSGTNTVGNISLMLQNSSTNANFTIFPSTLPAYGGGVFVTCTPTGTGPFYGTISVNANGVVDIVYLSGNGVNNQPSVLVNPASLNFGNVSRDQTKTMTFTVTGTNLTDNFVLSSDNLYFSVSPTTITPVNGNVNETVTVAYHPTAAGNHSGAITVSDGTISKTVSVSGACRPSISVTTSRLDFGNFFLGETISREFSVVGSNTVDDILLTLQNTPTYTYITVNPAILPPGGGTVTVTCVSSCEGDISGSLVVSTAGAADRVIDLVGECIEPVISVNPNELDFGIVLVGQTKQKTFTVMGTKTVGNISLALQNTSTHADFSIYPETLPASGGTVTVRCDANSEGDISGKIILSSPGAYDVTLNLSGVAMNPSITVYPSSLDFGNVFVGRSKKMTFTVEGTNTVDDISLTLPSTNTNANFTISPETLPASGGTVTVTCFPTSAGEINETLLVSTPGADVKTVTLSGTARLGPPSIMASPTSLNFGTLRRGEIKSMTFTVKGRNLTDDLSITCDNPEFVLDRTFITPALAASGVTVIVIYNANTIGDISGTITIAGSGAPSKTVRLTAICEGSGDNMW